MRNFCTTNPHPSPQQNRQEPAGDDHIVKEKAVETKYTCLKMHRRFRYQHNKIRISEKLLLTCKSSGSDDVRRSRLTHSL